MHKNYIKPYIPIIVCSLVSYFIVAYEAIMGMIPAIESILEKILYVISHLMVISLFFTLITYASIFNLKYLFNRVKKTGRELFIIIISGILELIAVFCICIGYGNFPGTLFVLILIIIAIVLLCMGIKLQIRTQNSLSKAMILWGISSMLFIYIPEIMNLYYFGQFVVN